MRACFSLYVFVFLISCQETTTTTSDLIEHIPRKTAVIIKTTDYSSMVSVLRNNDFIALFEKTPLYESLSNYSRLSRYLDLKEETLLCFSPIGKNDYELTLITKTRPGLRRIDSTKVRTSSSQITGGTIIKIVSDQDTYYMLEKDDIFMMSTSSLLLENATRKNKSSTILTPALKKAYQVGNTTSNILINGQEGKDLWDVLFPNNSINVLNNSFSWASLDLVTKQKDLQFDGIVLVQDSTDQRLSIFKDTKPIPNRIAEIAPVSAKSITSLTYDNWTIYKRNLALSQDMIPEDWRIAGDSLFSTFDEVSRLTLGDDMAIAAHSKDILQTDRFLSSFSKVEDFRQVSVYNLTASSDSVIASGFAFAKAYPLLSPISLASVYCKINDFYVFAPSQEILEQIIANYQNNATLSKDDAFIAAMTQLSSASSLNIIENLNEKRFAHWSGSSSSKIIEDVNLENFPYGILQFIQERDFMHVHSIISKNEAVNQEGIVAQIASIKLDSDIIKGPQLVKNHRTKGMDIVVQDMNNKLYLISNSGRILWSKELDNPILGEIKQVDLYRNGRLQLAFNTQKGFYILDRNGNHVAPFPIEFEQELSQPVAIFDYENNRNYRFVITQGDRISMYDKNAKRVSGFTFDQSEATVVYPPQHIRLGNKDYILIAENNGKLNILSRTGSSRITVKDHIDFGDTPFFKEGAQAFGIYDINGSKVSISEKGNVTKKPTSYSSATAFSNDGISNTALNENELFIKGKAITLDYGTYTAPRNHKVGRTIYTTITNTESRAVFIYNDKGEKLENTPVYGLSSASIGYLERNKSLGFAVLGDTDTILIYKVN